MNLDTLHKDYSLKTHNTFGIDVKANYFLPYSNEDTLLRFLPEINEFQLQPLIIGEGSNLLFLNDYKGIVLLPQIKGYELTSENENYVEVRVGSGVIWDDFVTWAVQKDYGGTENLSIIPGTVGASPVQNIGAYGVEAQDIITKVETIELATGRKCIFTNEECQFSYRNSIFKKALKGQYAVNYVTYRLSKNPEFNTSYGNINQLLGGRKPSLTLIRDVVSEVRNSKLPDHKTLGNAGSFFTNPYISKEHFEILRKKHPEMPGYETEGKMKVPAGWLIDHAGLKGYKHKNAAVHDKQALVLINTGDATGNEILELSQLIIEKVEKCYQITLKPEVNII